MSRHILPRVFLAAALVAAAAAFSSAGPDDDTIPKSEVPGRLSETFDKLRSRYPNLNENVDRYQQYFKQGFLNLKTEKYSEDDIKFIDKVAGHVFDIAAQYPQIIGNPNLTDAQKREKIKELKLQSQQHRENEQKFLEKHPGIHSDVASLTGQTRGGDASGTTQNADKSGGNGGNKSAAKTEVDKDQKDISAVVFDSARKSFAPTNSNSPAGNFPSGPSLGDTLGGPQDPNNASSVMAKVGDDLMQGNVSAAMTDADKAVDLGGGAPALAMRGGIELDQSQYSKAGQDAHQALQLDPSNKEASVVAHFAEGRTDGIATGAPAGEKAGGANGGFGGGAGSGAQGGSGSYAGGNAPAGEASGSLASAALSPAGGASAAGLSAGGAQGAAISRMSGEQAQKAAQNALAMKDYGGALAFVNRALAQNPKDPGLLALRSKIYAGQRDYKHAIEDAKAGLASDPKNPQLLRALGFAQLRDKDFQGALATANQMLELNPNDPYAYALRGHAYGSLGDRDAMMADLQRAAELDPSFAAAAAQMANKLQLPEDKDILFLFPGEDAAASAKTAEPASGRRRNFGLLVGASALGGLLLAMGLLATVLAPLKAQLTSAFTRITRTGPTVGVVEDDSAQPASINGIMPGMIRGQYEISRQIGAGGMGMVFAGMDRSLGRPVAIKKMREELRYDEREKARFVSEAKTVAALHHRNIVDIYAIAEDGGDVFLVFEYVDGKTVHELVQASGRLRPEQAAKIVRASSDALEYAHAHGVIHRDMKPSNVMINGAGVVKVMDFGIARMAKDTLGRHSMTNTVVGTPPYMAPEQEQGQVRAESDVYALAICAYEMLCGKLPFVGVGGGMLLNKISMSFIPPSRETEGLPPALDAVFDRALQADPDKRYRTPHEFADALETALSAAVRA